jgi:type I restriction enzyme S subunit
MIETKFKQTEIGLIPEDWNVYKISDIASVTTGSRNTQDRCPGGKYPFYVRSQEIERINSYSFDTEGVITAGDGVGTGKVYHYVNGKFELHQRAYLIYAFNGISPKYFYKYFSQNFYERVSSMTAKSSVDSVRKEMITDMQIAVPQSLAEQQRIASALTSIDNLLSSLDKLIAKKRDIKQGAMQQLLTGKTRLKGFTEPWVKYKIDDLFDIGNGYTPSKANPAFWNNGTIPWFRMEDIRTNGRILRDSIQHVTPAAVKSSGLFPAFSIILSTTATIGEHALLIADSLANQRFSFLIRKLNRCSDIDIWYFFYHCFILGDWCRANINDGGLMAVNINDLKNYTFEVPSTLKEQQAIASVLSSIDNEIAALEAKRKKYEAVKQGMMQQLLTGKIRLL